MKNHNFKKTILVSALVSLLIGASAAQAWDHPHTPPVITGNISGSADGGAWAGGTGSNLQTLTQSSAWTNGSIFSQNLGYNTGWSVDAGFSNLAQAVNGGAGPSSALTSAWGNAGITVIPPSMPHYEP